MATTTQVTLTKTWVKLSDGDCTVQSNSNEQLPFAISATTPTTEAALLLSVSEPITLAYKSPVWCRLPRSYTGSANIVVNVIK